MLYNVTGSVTYAHAINVEIEADNEQDAIEHVHNNIDEYSNESMCEMVKVHIDKEAEVIE